MTLVIIGAGAVGAELALHSARSGMDVVLNDVSAAALARAREEIAGKERFGRLLGIESADRPAIDRIEFISEPPFGRADDFLVEAITEDPETKAALLARADAECAERVILASSTSAIPISWLAAQTARPDRVIGIHFMSPVTMIPAVELIEGEATSADTRERAVSFIVGLGKEAVPAGDGPGFIANRVIMLAINEAVALIEEGRGDAHMVDRVFTSCLGHKMGPLALADLIGLESVVRTLTTIRDFSGDARFEPRPLLMALVREGALGLKAGRGFHDYRPD
jgi:3-hydroxybutyryl-CoA dehydrogenase